MGKNRSIILMQTAYSRAINVGFIKKNKFVPCRMNLGVSRQSHTFLATVESLKLPKVQTILKKYKAQDISTITILRETLACQIGQALGLAGVNNYFGETFIGVTHIKQKGIITTSYKYENTEGLSRKGLWIIAESICVGRNLAKTMEELLSKNSPTEIIFICPIASQSGIENISKLIKKYNIAVTFVVWGALFGVDEKTFYDMPWGHNDTKAVDSRDKQTFINIYGPNLCVGGDFGNDYYCPSKARNLYKQQLKQFKIKPKIPSVEQVLASYKENELIRE